MPNTFARFTLFTLFVLMLAAPAAHAAQRLSFTAEEMKTALHTARPEEDGFVDDVVDRVNNSGRPASERLPAALVESTFQWARKKNTHRRFQYFRYALVLRAGKIGINL